MSLQFVLGSSGSGKTEYVYGQIVAQAGASEEKLSRDRSGTVYDADAAETG